MPTLKYWDQLTQSYKPILAAAQGEKGDKGDKGDTGPPGGMGSLDQISDVVAPPSTPVGKVLGTTSVGLWGPIDPPPTGLSQAQADARYVNVTGPETLTGDFSITGTFRAESGAVVSTYLNSSGGIAAGGKISGVATPTATLDGANKSYVDSRIWSGTQAAYNAIVTKDPWVLYVIVA